MKKLLFILLIGFASCQKKQDIDRPQITVDYTGDELYGFGYETFKGKPAHPHGTPPGQQNPKPVDTVIIVNPPDTTTDPEPPTTANAFVVFLDPDGHQYAGAYWENKFYGPADAALDMSEVIAAVRVQYAAYNVRFIDSEYEFSQANPYMRQRVVITSDNSRSGSGYAYVGSGFWGPEAGQLESPMALVLSSNLQNYEFYVSEIAAHEIGHTLRLVHVHLWNSDCTVNQTYLGGYVMGNGTYGGDSQWHPGHPCRFQGGAYGRSDDAVLAEGVGRN